jgi:hypothetical protein
MLHRHERVRKHDDGACVDWTGPHTHFDWVVRSYRNRKKGDRAVLGSSIFPNHSLFVGHDEKVAS